MKLNKIILTLPALFAMSISTYAAEVPPESFPPKVATPDISTVLNGSEYTEPWQAINDRWQGTNGVSQNNITKIEGKQYINGKNIVRSLVNKPLATQELQVNSGSYFTNNSVDSAQITMKEGSIAIGNTLRGGIDDKLGVLALESGAQAFDTIIENKGSMGVRKGSEAYNTLVKQGGVQVISGYAQANIIDGGEQQISLTSMGVAEDNIIINGGTQYIWGGTAKNSHIGNGSYQLASGLSLETKVYSGGYQLVYSGSGSSTIADQDSTIYAGGTQRVQSGISDGATIYGEQIITNKNGDWVNGSWVEGIGTWGQDPKATNAVIQAGGVQRIASNGKASDTTVNSGGTQIINESGQAFNTTVKGGTQIINKLGHAFDNIIDGGTQQVKAYGHIENTTIQNGGSSTIDFGAYSFGDLNIKNGSLTMEAGDLHDWTDLLGKGAYARNVNLEGDQSNIYIKHNANTSESTATIDHLTSNNGLVIFGQKDGSDAGKFSRLNLKTLTGSGTFVMNTNIAGNDGDFLYVEQKIADPDLFKVVIRDTGAEISEYRHHLISAGKDSLDDTFTIRESNSRADAGAYMVQYTLEHSTNSGTNEEDWHLVAQRLTTTTPATDSALAIANVAPTVWDAELSTLRQRLGDLENNTHSNGVWGKYIGSQYKVDKENGAAYKQDMNGFLIGADHAVAQSDGTLHLGLMAGYSESDVDFRRGGDGTVDSYTFGGYATYISNSGLYLDGVLKYNYFKNATDARSTGGDKLSGSYNTSGVGLSLEVGKKYEKEEFFAIPYVLASGFHAGSADYTLNTHSSEMKVNVDKTSSLKAEVGSLFGKNFKLNNGGNIKPYVKLAASYEFVDNNKVRINNVHEFNNDISGAAIKAGLGITAQLGSNFSAYAEVDYMKADDSSMPYSADVGIRYSF